ncbi:MAG: quinoprotein relay system zinc metallohydrolase 2 [Burkholderiales bacterium]
MLLSLHRPVGALLLGAFLHGAAAAQGVADAAPLALAEVAPGVYVHAGRIEDWLPGNGGDIANLGFVVGSRCVAVIDSGGTPQLGQRWRAAIERTTRVPICFVINTHAHPDHVLGNAAFAGPDTRFVAGAKFSAALSAREPYFLNALARDFGVHATHDAMVYPTLTVDGTRELDLGDRVLVLRAWPTAHTDNDLTVYDRRTRTLFASDLLFAQHIPVVDGSLRGWLAVMQDLAAIDAARVVPGHGPISDDWPAALKPQQEYLETLRRETRAALKAGKTLPQAVDSVGIEAATHWQLADRFHRRNVTAAFAELEWED